MIVATFPMPAGLVFDWHTHPDHQLAWAASGVLMVRTRDATWVLPPTRALWIPAGIGNVASITAPWCSPHSGASPASAVECPFRDTTWQRTP